jgi:amino acid permease
MAILNDESTVMAIESSTLEEKADIKESSEEKGHGHNIDGEVVQSASGALDAVYGVGGVGRTQRRLKARHITFIGFGGGIGTGLFIGTGVRLRATTRDLNCLALKTTLSSSNEY